MTILAAAVMLLSACTTADDQLGYDFVPDNQKMRMRHKVMESSKLLATRLFRTDSIISSNISYGYMGAQKDPDFGTRKAGFYTQYMVYGTSDSTGFGYRPIFDSIQILLSVVDFKGDTLEPQKFNVYEVTDYFFDDNVHADGTTDSIFYLTFDPSDFHGKRYISDRPAFTFTFPDGKSTGPSTSVVRMEPTETGLALVRRWMLVDGEYRDNDMSVYNHDRLWVDCFKGLYIEPASDVEKGAMFALDLENSGITFYGRNRNEQDPEFVRDTTQALYYFYYKKSKYGNQSVNSIRHDYSATPELAATPMYEDEPERPETAMCYIEGMGGPMTEIRITDDFFAMMESLLDDTEDGDTDSYTNIAFNQARMLVYLRESEYDWDQIVPDILTPAMEVSMGRLGLYTDFKTMTPVDDYNYLYESQYSTSLNYGGYLSRSLGCYRLDITAYVQRLWNNYRKLEDKSDLSTIPDRTLYLAPSAYDVYGFGHTVIQGAADSAKAPIKIELTYTLIK